MNVLALLPLLWCRFSAYIRYCTTLVRLECRINFSLKIETKPFRVVCCVWVRKTAGVQQTSENDILSNWVTAQRYVNSMVLCVYASPDEVSVFFQTIKLRHSHATWISWARLFSAQRALCFFQIKFELEQIHWVERYSDMYTRWVIASNRKTVLNFQAAVFVIQIRLL